MSVPFSLLTPWFRLVIRKQRILHPTRHLTISADTFHCYNLVATTGIWKVEARDATKHSVLHRTACTPKNYLAQNVNSAEIEKLQFRLSYFLFGLLPSSLSARVLIFCPKTLFSTASFPISKTILWVNLILLSIYLWFPVTSRSKFQSFSMTSRPFLIWLA